MAPAVRRVRSAKNVAGKQKNRALALPWSIFMRQHPHAHLLTATCETENAPGSGYGGRVGQLRKLASALCRSGHFAVTSLRPVEDGGLVLVGLARREDAERLSRALGARTAPVLGDWRSHRAFIFDMKAARRISALVGNRR